jgi:hypothetical protein
MRGLSGGGTTVVKYVKLGIVYAVFIGGLGLYVVLYIGFLKHIVDADGAAPNLDNGTVQLATGIGGLLAAIFAVAFGIQRSDPTVDEKKLKLGQTLTPRAEVVTSVCLVVYFLVGAAAAIITLLNSAETPLEIKTPVTIFVGYIVTIFMSVLRGPGQTA